MRYEECPACGRPTAVGKRSGVMREHVRAQYLGTLTLTVRCRGSNSVFPPVPAPAPAGPAGPAVT